MTNNDYMYIQSKHENIYNKQEYELNSCKDLIVSILLSRKVVMMVGDESMRNLWNHKY